MSAKPRTRPNLVVWPFRSAAVDGHVLHVGRHARHGTARLLGRSLIGGVRRGHHDHRFGVVARSAHGPRFLRAAGRVDRRRL